MYVYMYLLWGGTVNCSRTQLFTVSHSLLSFRQEKNELFLVTEFVADGSLDRFLTENMCVP